MLSYEQIKNLETSFGSQATPLINVLEGMGQQLRADIAKDLATKEDLAKIQMETVNIRLEVANLRGEWLTNT